MRDRLAGRCRSALCAPSRAHWCRMPDTDRTDICPVSDRPTAAQLRAPRRPARQRAPVRVVRPPRATSPRATSAASTARWSRTGTRVECTLCLAFPDVYDIGMSHLGFKILYSLLNAHPRSLAERATRRGSTWRRSCARAACRCVSLESARPLRDFDVVGFSLQFELTYTNVLAMLDSRRHPAARGRSRRGRSARHRRRPDRDAPRAAGAVHRRLRHRRRRGEDARARARPGPRSSAPACRARERLRALAKLRRRLRARRSTRSTLDADTGCSSSTDALDPAAAAARASARSCPTSTSSPSPPTARWPTPRRSSIACRSRSRAAAPRAAASARPA